MKYIDKSIHQSEFDEYTKQYLRDAGQTGEFIPPLSSEQSYLNFSRKEYKNTSIPAESAYHGWLDVLMREQEGRCCYCMRELPADEVSVEHLVPENFTGLDETKDINEVEKDEYKFYCEKAPRIDVHVQTGSMFDAEARANLIDVATLEKMPHLIAHSNLFPACNCKKGCSCNNHRGNNRILPLMLMEDVDDWLVYDENGELVLHYSEIDISKDTLKYLDINTDTLKEIRHLWYEFSRKRVTPEMAKLAKDSPIDRDRYLKDALGVQLLPSEYVHYLTDSFYWNRFLQYSWFYDYYLNKYPL